MSVLACNRTGCENIMCDRLSYEHGYICDSCFEALVTTDPIDVAAFMGNPSENKAGRSRRDYEHMFEIR